MVLGREVGAAVAVGTGVGVGVGGIIIGVGEGIGVEVGVAGTGVYLARLSTQPVMAKESKPTNTTASLARCLDCSATRRRLTNIIVLRVGYREATTA